MAAVPAANRARTRDSGEPRYVLPVRRYVVFIVAAVGAVLSAACHLNGCFLAWHRRTQTCATIPARSQRQDSSDESGGEDGADEVVEGGTPLHCEDRMEVQHVEDEETKLRRQLRERDARIAVLEASVISLTNSRSATSGAKAEREKKAGAIFSKENQTTWDQTNVGSTARSRALDSVDSALRVACHGGHTEEGKTTASVVPGWGGECWREAPTGGKKSKHIWETRYDEGEVQVAVQWYEVAVEGEEEKWEMMKGPPATTGVVVNTTTGVVADCFNGVDLRLSDFEPGLGKKDGYGVVHRQRRNTKDWRNKETGAEAAERVEAGRVWKVAERDVRRALDACH